MPPLAYHQITEVTAHFPHLSLDSPIFSSISHLLFSFSLALLCRFSHLSLDVPHLFSYLPSSPRRSTHISIWKTSSPNNPLPILLLKFPNSTAPNVQMLPPHQLCLGSLSTVVASLVLSPDCHGWFSMPSIKVYVQT